MPDIGDVIELSTDFPERNLRAGLRGAIVHRHNDEAYEIEFSNDDGETLELIVLHPRQFIVVWRAETEQWVPIAEQIVALLASLPEDLTKEILDFTRFLAVKNQLSTRQAQDPMEASRQAW